ncbi:glutamate ABC transporter substrate-binding protein [Trebonia kvetii]|uniref:Glutamate ABC transporter substrate-binding protein n=1 Tax=Trebonia kvetii TaxID=2480626 RepID=A0A6P2BYB0_9ACTN|nr:glutamate ABC transporter substrate-binding protein [Trebonia kvetii]
MLAAAALAGCSAAPGPHAAQAPRSHPAAPAAGHTARAKTQAVGSVPECNPYASSLAPLAGTPQVTTGSWMAHIRKRGHLIAGVDQNTYHFGYLNPLDGQFEGFDIDMVKAVAQAIFGSPGHITYRAISDDQRKTDIQNGSVDIVAHTMTILCSRLKDEDFSSVYFTAHQRVLVLKDSTVTGLDQLGGQKVCATKGSDSAGFIAHYNATSPVAEHPVVVPVTFWTDCLVLLQQRQVAAVSTDDTILEGLQAQDPFTKLVGSNLTDEPYGLAIAKQHPEFVRFVNAVLARMYKDGSWEKSYNHWVSPSYVTPPQPKYAN